MKYAICNEVYEDWSFDQAFAHARKAGYSGLEIAPFTLSNEWSAFNSSDRENVRQIAEKNDLQIIGLHWLLAGTRGYCLTSPDSEIRKRTVSYLAELTGLCRDLGGSLMVFGSPVERNLATGVDHEMGEGYAVEIIEQLLPQLEAAEIVLALEPLGPEETNFLNTADSTIQLLRRLDSKNVRLHLDVKAMASESVSIPEVIESSSQYVCHLHANDPNRQGPGMGDVEFEPIVQALRNISYDGWMSVEVFDYEPGIERLVNDSINYLKSVEQRVLGQ